MTTPDPLDTLRAALLDRAATTAAGLRADAERAAAEAVAAANQRAERLLTQARARGEQEARDAFAAEQARGRAAARGVVLAAQRRAYDELREQSRVAVRELLSDPAVRSELAAALRSRVGEPAEVVDAPDGGLVGRAPGRTVDASVEALVEQALAGLDLGELWAR